MGQFGCDYETSCELVFGSEFAEALGLLEQAWPAIRTQEQFLRAGREWEGATFVAQGSEDRLEVERARKRCEAVERALDAAPFEMDDDGEVVDKRSPLIAYAVPFTYRAQSLGASPGRPGGDLIHGWMTLKAQDSEAARDLVERQLAIPRFLDRLEGTGLSRMVSSSVFEPDEIDAEGGIQAGRPYVTSPTEDSINVTLQRDRQTSTFSVAVKALLADEARLNRDKPSGESATPEM